MRKDRWDGPALSIPKPENPIAVVIYAGEPDEYGGMICRPEWKCRVYPEEQED